MPNERARDSACETSSEPTPTTRGRRDIYPGEPGPEMFEIGAVRHVMVNERRRTDELAAFERKESRWHPIAIRAREQTLGPGLPRALGILPAAVIPVPAGDRGDEVEMVCRQFDAEVAHRGHERAAAFSMAS